ncbi:N-acetylmuramoyl-L-alanine amidase [Clostridium sp. LP20]|uniref:N-acetylmuramoyl-L-alanine amidase n=1 Tax=Clostridium sp. LP20 TaxID=3418665 RepID=UPI003EE4BB0A
MKKRLIALVLGATLFLNYIPVNIVQAYEAKSTISAETRSNNSIVDIDIISSSAVNVEQAKAWARSRNATQQFIDLAELFWKYAPKHGGINPAIAYVQSAKETAYGRFGGVLDATYYNTCGMKNSGGGGDYDPNAHKRFDNWEHGVQAQLDHLALYAGASGFPKGVIEQKFKGDSSGTSYTYDVRHFSNLYGTAKMATQLTGKWAGGTYGFDIVEMHNTLMISAGVKKTGWNNEAGKWYYLNANGKLTKGWFQEGDKWYYLDENGVMKTGWLTTGNTTYYLDASGVMKTGWQDINGSRYYFNKFGHMSKGDCTIDGKNYSFDSNGKLIGEVGKIGWVESNNNWYYYNNKGEMAKGWLQLGSTWYYLNKDGIMQTGWQVIGESIYYFKSYGAMVTGTQKIGDKTYEFSSSGYVRTADWYDINGKWYYGKTDGAIAKGWLRLGNTWYYLNNNGEMVTGWQDIDGARYYFKSYGAMVTGINTIDGLKYEFSSSGALVGEIGKSGWIKENGKWYYLDSAGKKVQGWNKVSGIWYYMGKDSVMVTGWQIIDSSIYYFQSSGAMVTGTQKIDGKTYDFSSSGYVRTADWYNINGKWYYSNTNGAIAKGWLKLGSTWYYLNNTGEMVTGWQDIDGDRYYFKSYGAMVTGRYTIDGKPYMFASSGKLLKESWVKENNKWYYYNQDGIKCRGWLYDDTKFYYLNEDGSMVTGEKIIGGKTYYFFSDGHMASSEWVNNKYYTPDGEYKDGTGKNPYIIVIDPGHNYGGDDGAYATHNGIQYSERELNMQIAIRLQAILQSNGYRVIMTRKPGEIEYLSATESLGKRVDLANLVKADFFVSIHHDSFNKPSANGMSVFYDTYRPGIESVGLYEDSVGNTHDSSPQNVALVSKKFAEEFIQTTSSSVGFYNRGVQSRNFYVTKNTNMPSVLIECGFITSPDDIVKITNSSHQQNMAQNIANQLNKFFKK